MNKQMQLLLLRNFFSGYFHEDWLCEDESYEAVVVRYTRTAKPSDVLLLSQAIREYSNEFPSDLELEKKLFTDLGCYFCPSALGISAKAWLEGIADQLLRETRI
jgi:hypothetical protein